jgi:hypothetical protein
VRPFSRAFRVFVRLLLIQPPFAAIARRLCLFGVCVALPGFTVVCWDLLRIAGSLGCTHTFSFSHSLHSHMLPTLSIVIDAFLLLPSLQRVSKVSAPFPVPFVYLCVCYSFSRRLPQLRAAYACLVFVWLCRGLL